MGAARCGLALGSLLSPCAPLLPVPPGGLARHCVPRPSAAWHSCLILGTGTHCMLVRAGCCCCCEPRPARPRRCCSLPPPQDRNQFLPSAVQRPLLPPSSSPLSLSSLRLLPHGGGMRCVALRLWWRTPPVCPLPTSPCLICSPSSSPSSFPTPPSPRNFVCGKYDTCTRT